MSIQVRQARETDIEEIFVIRTSVAENHLSLAQLAEMGITPETIASMLAQASYIWVSGTDQAPFSFPMVQDETGCAF